MTTHGLSADDLQRLIDQDLPMGRALALKVDALEPGKVTLRLPFRATLARPGGTVSGPAQMALADCAMYAVVLSLRGDAIMAVTSNLTIHFLRAPRPVDLIAHGELLRLGRRLAVVEVTLCAEGDPKPVAHVTGTYALPGQAHGEGPAVP